MGRIYVHFSSEYADVWANTVFSVQMSLDNTSWVTVPVLSPWSNNRSEFADLGRVGLDSLVVTLYGRRYFPEQTVALPPNVTGEQVRQSLKGNVMVQQEEAPRDTTLRILVSVTLFAAILRITDLLSSKEKRPQTFNDCPAGLGSSLATQRNRPCSDRWEFGEKPNVFGVDY
jgi:hypothetical protein